MPRITPTTRTINEDIEPDEFYEVTLKSVKPSVGSSEFGSEPQLTLEWEYPDSSTALDWLSLRLGKQQNGTVAKLRQCLNSVSAKPYDTEIAWFDSDTLEFSYEEEGPAYNKLAPGLRCLARGIRGTKQDGQPKFKIDAYRPLKKGEAKKKLQPAASAQDVDPDEIPF